jgi:hypothetical protein
MINRLNVYRNTLTYSTTQSFDLDAFVQMCEEVMASAPGPAPMFEFGLVY